MQNEIVVAAAEGRITRPYENSWGGASALNAAGAVARQNGRAVLVGMWPMTAEGTVMHLIRRDGKIPADWLVHATAEEAADACFASEVEIRSGQ